MAGVLLPNVIWCSCKKASILTANTAALPRAPPILSRRNEFLAKDKLHDSMLDMILELLPLLSSASSSVWVAQTSSGEINRLLSLTSPTNAKASSMTLYLFPWCSANRIARTRRLCSSLAIAASRSARCCDWTVCRGTHHKLEADLKLGWK